MTLEPKWTREQLRAIDDQLYRMAVKRGEAESKQQPPRRKRRRK